MNECSHSGTKQHTNRWMFRCFCYAVIFMATWNAVLRPSSSIPVTPYYVLAPLICMVLVFQTRWAGRWFFLFLLGACYGIAVGTAYGVPILMQAAQLLKYGQLLIFFELLIWLYRVDPVAPLHLHHMVRILTILVFLIAGVQVVTGLEFPTVVNEGSSDWLNTFFYTPNDLGLFLCGVFCIVLISKAEIWKKFLFFMAFLGLNLRNDAKAAILASLLMICMYVLVQFCMRMRIKPLIGLLILVASIPLTVMVMGDIKIVIGDSQFDFMELFLDPLDRIVNLELYNLGGSIFDRTDALIHALAQLKSTSFIGLGPAGSVYMLSLPNFELLSAKSLHNAIAEVLVEFGPVAFFLGLFLLRPYGRALLSTRPTRQQIGQMCLLAGAPMLSVSQSSGYISNYAFWLTVFIIWYPPVLFRHATQTKILNGPQKG